MYKNFPFLNIHAQQIVSAFGTTNFCASKNELFFMPPFSTSAYKLNVPDKRIDTQLHFCFGNNSIPEDFIDKSGLSNIFEKLKKKKYMLGWGNFYIDNDFFCFTTILGQTEKTVLYNIKQKKAVVYNELQDINNEIPIHINFQQCS